MIIILTSFLAGILSVLAPCVLPMIPILLGGGIIGDKRKPLRIIGSAMICIFVFTYFLKISTAFIDIDPSTWNWISGSIIGLYGLVLIFPELWDRVVVIGRNIRLLRRSAPRNDEISSNPRNDAVGDVLLGASLGPIFATCSPTYALLLGTVLPVSTSLAVFGILAYMIGFGGFLYLLTLGGRQIIKKFYNISDNNSRFKKILGLILVVLGICIATGYIKTIEANLISGVSDISAVEQFLLQRWGVNSWIDEKLGGDGMNLIEEDLEVLDTGE